MRFDLYILPLVLSVFACAHSQRDDIIGSPPTATAMPAPAEPTAATGAGGEPAARTSSCQRDWECGEGSLCVDGRCALVSDRLDACQQSVVHFDFDRAELHSDETPVLERIARCLKADRKMHVLVDGNADERGTLEYNLALGDKRARVVAKYLKNLGVSDAQIATVTYGEGRPVCMDHDEACWYQNRRAGLVAKR